jgi:hypothetical protein
MKEVYLNGKDVCIDADFFVGIGADRDTIVVSPERIEKLHYIKFTLDGCGYTAYWSNFNNRLNIKCNDLELKDGEIADKRLYRLNKKITQDILGDLFVRKIVVWPEGDMPELMMLFYEK